MPTRRRKSPYFGKFLPWSSKFSLVAKNKTKVDGKLSAALGISLQGEDPTRLSARTKALEQSTRESPTMNLSFQTINALANRAQSRQVTAFANESLRSAVGPQEEVLVADTTGYHLYGDLHTTLELSAATQQEKANLFLEVLEDLAGIVSDFARAEYHNILIFEVQGERIHLFLNRNQLNAETIAELVGFSAYFTDAVYETIKPKIEKYWAGFCMAADLAARSC